MNFIKKKNRRSDIKVITKEGRVLKYFRTTRRFSMRRAAQVIGVSEAVVNHVENGRMDVSAKLIKSFLNGYGYSFAEFTAYLQEKEQMPTSDLEECLALIRKMDRSKLKTVKAILQTF